MTEQVVEHLPPEVDTPPVYVRRVERKKSIRDEKETEFQKRARRIFDAADTDNTGELSMDQARNLAIGMHKAQGTEFKEEEFQVYFADADLNKDGKL